MTRITLADGAVKTEPIKFAGAAPSASRPPGQNRRQPAPSDQQPNQSGPCRGKKCASERRAKPVERESLGDQFVADGADVVQLKVDLLEHKTIAHQAMKAPKRKPGRRQSHRRPKSGSGRTNDQRHASGADRRRGRGGRQSLSGHPAPRGRPAPPRTGPARWSARLSFFALKTLNVSWWRGMSSRFSTRTIRNFGRPI